MANITISVENTGRTETLWRALVGEKISFGKTAGEALDALTAQLDEADSSTIVVRQMQPDRFFTAMQQKRLAELMSKWRSARDSGVTLSPNEESELEVLIETELEATTKRSDQLFHDLKK